jgi:F-type H+-transporting ATPase subunit b
MPRILAAGRGARQLQLSLADKIVGARRTGLADAVEMDAGRLASENFAPENPEGEEPATGRELWYKLINFAILVGALAFLLRKPAAQFMAQRSESIRKSLEESRKALEASQAQIRAIEEKLRGLEEEISRFKAAAAQEMEAERERLRLAAAAEAERILQFAHAEIDNATRAAKLELKVYAARQAVELAEAMIRQQLDEAGQHRLVGRFVGELDQKQKLGVSRQKSE